MASAHHNTVRCIPRRSARPQRVLHARRKTRSRRIGGGPREEKKKKKKKVITLRTHTKNLNRTQRVLREPTRKNKTTTTTCTAAASHVKASRFRVRTKYIIFSGRSTLIGFSCVRARARLTFFKPCVASWSNASMCMKIRLTSDRPIFHTEKYRDYTVESSTRRRNNNTSCAVSFCGLRVLAFVSAAYVFSRTTSRSRSFTERRAIRDLIIEKHHCGVTRLKKHNIRYCRAKRIIEQCNVYL